MTGAAVESRLIATTSTDLAPLLGDADGAGRPGSKPGSDSSLSLNDCVALFDLMGNVIGSMKATPSARPISTTAT